MKAEISPSLRPSPVRAVVHTAPEMSVPALVMNCLTPSMTHRPSRSRARVRVAPASEPASGSVRPKAPRARPEQSLGIHSSRWASVPNRAMGWVPSDVWAQTVMATLESMRASSSMAMA